MSNTVSSDQTSPINGGKTLSVGRTCLHDASLSFFSSYFVENNVIFRITALKTSWTFREICLFRGIDENILSCLSIQYEVYFTLCKVFPKISNTWTCCYSKVNRRALFADKTQQNCKSEQACLFYSTDKAQHCSGHILLNYYYFFAL